MPCPPLPDQPCQEATVVAPTSRPSSGLTGVSVMDQRQEFVRSAMQQETSRRDHRRQFAISPTTGCEWLHRGARVRPELAERSRRPHSQPRASRPGRIAAALESHMLDVRDAHPAWGARKIVAGLERAGVACVGCPLWRASQQRNRLDPQSTCPPSRWTGVHFVPGPNTSLAMIQDGPRRPNVKRDCPGLNAASR
jgi:hypothetical protein